MVLYGTLLSNQSEVHISNRHNMGSFHKVEIFEMATVIEKYKLVPFLSYVFGGAISRLL